MLRTLLSSLPGLFFLRLVLRHMSFLIPAERLIETDHLLAFFHPRPSYPFHALLVPKEAYKSLLDLPAGAPFLSDLVTAVQTLVQRFELAPRGYRLIANGGSFQDVPHLHFHLIAESNS